MVRLSALVIIVSLLTLIQFVVGSATVASDSTIRTRQEASNSEQSGASAVNHNNGSLDHFGFGSDDDQSLNDKSEASDEKHSQPSDPNGRSSAAPDSSEKASDSKFDRDDITNRLFELFNEDPDSKTEILDEKSLNLANGFEKFNEEVVKIYREELQNLRLHPNDVYRDKHTKLSALEQNGDEIFYKWFAFSLTTKKIVNSLAFSLSSKFIEHSELNLSPKCMLSMLISLEELKQQKLWVVKMLDTTGKPEFHNVLDGSIVSLGGYDQCLAIESPKLLRSKPGKIYGKYCLVKYDIPLPARPKHIDIRTRLFNYTNTEMEGTAIEDFSSFAHALYEQKPRLGFCIPSLCHEKDLQLMLDICECSVVQFGCLWWLWSGCGIRKTNPQTNSRN